MSASLHNVHRKPWFNEALRLGDLKRQIDELHARLGDDARVIGVFQPRAPCEARIVNVVTRGQLFEQLVGNQLNALGAEVTEIDIEEVTAESRAQLAQGEVVYIALGRPEAEAASLIYEDW